MSLLVNSPEDVPDKIESAGVKGLTLVQESLPSFQRLIIHVTQLCKSHEDPQVNQDGSKIEAAFQNFLLLLTDANGNEQFKSQNKEFWSHLRHDMRASLGGVKGYSELILDSLNRLPNQVAFINVLEEILKAVDNILPFIDQMRQDESPKLVKSADDHLSCYIGTTVQGGKILIVDDNQEKHTLIKRLLSISYSVTSALSGAEALKIIPEIRPDLIILDLVMPGMSGFEVLNILKANAETAEIPVLVISSLNEVDNVVQCLRAGAEDYLPMPLNPVILLTRINSCLQKKVLRDREITYIQELNESRLRLEKAIQSIDEGFAIFDVNERLLMSNQNFEEFYHVSEALKSPTYTYEEFLRSNLSRGLYLINHRKSQGDQENTDFPSLKEGEVWVQHKLALFRKETSTHVEALSSGKWMEIITNRIPEGGTVCVHKDVTNRILKEIEIKHLAHHDPLTGLANRLFFERELKASFKRALFMKESVSLMFFDLDGFKGINDTLGHEFGDFVLKSVASKLIASLRQEDLVARLGGDEFCAMIRNVKRQELERLAKRCLAAIGTSITRSNRTVRFGISIGIASYPVDGQTPKEVIEHADAAMYRAKNQGKGCYVFASDS